MVLVSVSDRSGGFRYKREGGFLRPFGNLRGRRDFECVVNRHDRTHTGTGGGPGASLYQQDDRGSHRDGRRMVFDGKRMVSQWAGNLAASVGESVCQLVLERRDNLVQPLAQTEFWKYLSAVSGLYVAGWGGNLAFKGGIGMAVCVFSKLKSVKKVMKTPGLSASMTVEASYVMAVVLLSLSVLIRTAYIRCGKTAEVMELHRAVERLRFGEEAGQKKTLPHGQAERGTRQVEGYLNAGPWEKEIISEIYEPEEVLRKMAVFEKNGQVHNGKGE